MIISKMVQVMTAQTITLKTFGCVLSIASNLVYTVLSNFTIFIAPLESELLVLNLLNPTMPLNMIVTFSYFLAGTVRLCRSSFATDAGRMEYISLKNKNHTQLQHPVMTMPSQEGLSTHISLAFFLCDKGKQFRSRSGATLRLIRASTVC